MKKVIGYLLFFSFLLGCCTTSKVALSDIYYIENPPEYIGGPNALEECLKEEILLSSKEYSGKVYLVMTISRKGKVENPTVYKSTTGSLKADKRAMEIVKGLTLFSPATLQGKTVASKYALVVDFDKYR